MIEAKFEDEINDLITENLYQWDSYQTLKISGINFDGITPMVHFCNKKSREALAVKGVLKSDGSVEVSIPNSLLSEKYDILAYIYLNTGLTYKTIKSITIPIIARLKPSAYEQPSNEDIAQIEEIELQAKLILDGLYPSDYSETATYQRPNIVYYNASAYMCLSPTEITGVEPTNTDSWQLICDGSKIENITKDDNGNLQFVFSNGKTYSVSMAVTEATTIDVSEIAKSVEHANNADNATVSNSTRCKYIRLDNASDGLALTTSDQKVYLGCILPSMCLIYLTVYHMSKGIYTIPLVYNRDAILGRDTIESYVKASITGATTLHIQKVGTYELYLTGVYIISMTNEV